jgi:hypothetical protein
MEIIDLEKMGASGLLNAIVKLETPLSGPARRMLRAYAVGGTAKEAALAAGYSERGATQRGHFTLQLPGAEQLIFAHRRLSALKNGVPLDWKRQKLIEIASSTAESGTARINAIRLLAELDGDLRPDSGGGNKIINVTLNLGDTTIGGDTFENEADYTKGGAARGLPTADLAD